MISKLKLLALPLLLIFAGRAAGVALIDATKTVQGYRLGEDLVLTETVVEPAGGTPVLMFSDLISGPDTGLGDGLGSGVIVTVWGYNLGSEQSTSTIDYCDSGNTCRPGHVYYWKNADGQLPSGPANLYESHGMHEIAFSIPDSAQGVGSIRVTIGSDNAALPFTVRSGSIYHVKSTGNDSSGDGSWANPWLTIAEADGNAPAGSTIYVHDVNTGSRSTDRVLYWNNASATSGLANQFATVAYPNNHPDVIGYRGTSSYNTEAWVVSKLSLFTGKHEEAANGQPTNFAGGDPVTIGITGSSNGRAVGNYLTDAHPSDVTPTCASNEQGAIKANGRDADEANNYKILGNMIEDYGCEGSNKLHHVTYISNRSDPNDNQMIAPEMGFNYLKNNWAKNGLHFYDYNGECGDYIGTFRIHNNVVVNQGGAGINIGAQCGETGDFLIENNVLINTGLAAAWNGQDVNTSDGPITSAIRIDGAGFEGNVTIRNNTIYQWSNDDQTGGSKACIGWSDNVGLSTPATFNILDNVCWTDKDKAFVGTAYNGSVPTALLTFDNNALYSAASSPSTAVNPAYATNSILTDPLLTLTGSRISVDSGSPIVGQSSTSLGRDIYGKPRPSSSNVGAVQSSATDIAGIIFETDFRNDAGYSITGESYFDFVDVPEGWDGVRTNDGTIEGVAGAGVDGGVAMRFTWPQKNGQVLANSLFKHLTGDENTGYDELYIRYKIRLPNNFKAGESGEALPFWKWGRLWQNTGLAGSGWTENRPDSYYIVFNWSPGLPQYGIRNNLTFGENLNTNSLGSAGGPRAGTDWYSNGAGENSDNIDAHIGVHGNWDNVGAGAWRFDHSTRFLANNTTQGWHTIEWRFKLSSTATANDGEFEVWFDGVPQVHPNVIDGIDQALDQPSTTNSLVTAALPGFNFFTLFDNMAEWSSDQPTEIYINDVVISTERIGHDYIAGSVQ